MIPDFVDVSFEIHRGVVLDLVAAHGTDKAKQIARGWDFPTLQKWLKENEPKILEAANQ